jgi:O-antigen/teichoic acid export membrane protein
MSPDRGRERVVTVQGVADRAGGSGPETDVLRAPTAGGKVIRGGAFRAGGHAVGVVIATATAVLLLRHLGVVDFGRFVTVTALLGIVAGLTDVGLTAVGSREMAVRPAGKERELLLANLLLIRLVATVVGVAGAVAFAILARYDDVMVLGTLAGGVGVVLINSQSMLTMPLWVDLRIVALTSLDVLRQVLTLVGVAALVFAGASLFPFFALQIAVGAAMVVATAVVLRTSDRLLPRYDRATARMLIRETLPLAVAFAMSIVYFRVLVIIVSLVSSETETGLFGTSFRIFETLLAVPAVVLGVALPLLSVAATDDEERLRYALQRMTETALLAGALLVVVIGVLAEPALRLVDEEYVDAAPVLRVQAVALLFVLLGQTWQLALVAARGQIVMVFANGVALVLVLVLGFSLAPPYGAQGAAWAALLAEAALALCLWLGIRRVRPNVVPDLRFAWKVLVALGLSVGAVLLVDWPTLVEALVAVVVLAGAAVVLRAIPPEIATALRFRA